MALSVVTHFGCASLPRDPKETLRQLQSRPIRVGLVEHPPWVMRTNDEPAGVEVDLMRNFAAQLGTTPDWHWGGEQEQMEALEHYQLDVVLGGFTDETPWSKYVGITRPYFEETYRVATPQGSQLQNLKGAEVWVEQGAAVGAKLEKKGARVVRVDDLARANGAVAAPDWQIEQMGLANTNQELDSFKHVLAVPPGENGFLKRLDEFLYTKRFEIRNLLQHQIAKK
jgi:polar amino acid transport system substrate-binding protein